MLPNPSLEPSLSCHNGLLNLNKRPAEQDAWGAQDSENVVKVRKGALLVVAVAICVGLELELLWSRQTLKLSNFVATLDQVKDACEDTVVREQLLDPGAAFSVTFHLELAVSDLLRASIELNQ